MSYKLITNPYGNLNVTCRICNQAAGMHYATKPYWCPNNSGGFPKTTTFEGEINAPEPLVVKEVITDSYRDTTLLCDICGMAAGEHRAIAPNMCPGSQVWPHSYRATSFTHTIYDPAPEQMELFSEDVCPTK